MEEYAEEQSGDPGAAAVEVVEMEERRSFVFQGVYPAEAVLTGVVYRAVCCGDLAGGVEAPGKVEHEVCLAGFDNHLQGGLLYIYDLESVECDHGAIGCVNLYVGTTADPGHALLIGEEGHGQPEDIGFKKWFHGHSIDLGKGVINTDGI
jgi:hypothetical protein